MTKRWAANTPDNFRFTAKMPQAVTHEKRLGQGSDDTLHYFFEAMTPLKDKLGCILIQLPPSMKKDEGLKKLKNLSLDNRYRYAVEPRHKSWFDGEVFDFFKESDLCLAWSQRDELTTPSVATTDFIYLRFIGDRSIAEKDFGTIQKDRQEEMQRWADVIKKAQKQPKLKAGFVPANNHYAGFGPGTAYSFLRMMGLEGRLWHETGAKEDNKQSSLFDFK